MTEGVYGYLVTIIMKTATFSTCLYEKYILAADQSDYRPRVPPEHIPYAHGALSVNWDALRDQYYNINECIKKTKKRGVSRQTLAGVVLTSVPAQFSFSFTQQTQADIVNKLIKGISYCQPAFKVSRMHAWSPRAGY